MKNIALVTGGSGFIGRALVQVLLDRGEAVRVLDLDVRSLRQLPVECVQGSINDGAAVSQAFATAETDQISSVFHLAGNAQLWNRRPAEFDRVNHQGTNRILEAAQLAGVPRFVLCSSLTTLIGRKTPIGVSYADEKCELLPDDLLGAYPASKRRAEIAALKSGRQHPMSVSVAIPTEPLGAGDMAITPPTKMILDFVNGKTPAYIDCMLNFVPVRSLAEGLIAVRDKGRASERYVLGGTDLPLQILLEKLQSITQRKMPTIKMPYSVALLAGFVDTHLVTALTRKAPTAPLTGVRLAGRQVSFSSRKAATDLHWYADDLDGALKEMLDWAIKEKLTKPF